MTSLCTNQKDCPRKKLLPSSLYALILNNALFLLFENVKLVSELVAQVLKLRIEMSLKSPLIRALLVI